MLSILPFVSNERSLEEAIRTLDEGLHQVKSASGTKALEILPDTKAVISITREDFVSRTYKEEEAPTIKQNTDGQIYELTFADGTKTFVVRQKTTGGNPFANPTLYGEMLPNGGLDMRKWITFTYEWDGQTTIKVTEPNGTVTEVAGEYGVPDILLPTLRSTLGHTNGQQTFENPINKNPPP